MNALFAVIQLFGSTSLFVVAAILAKRGDFPEATFFMAFACYLLLIFLASNKDETK